MHASIFLAGAIAIGAVVAQDIDNNDVPRACKDVCSSIVSLTHDCDDKTDDDDQYLDCVCKANNANTQVPLCASCISQHGDRDNDAYDIVRSCSFSSTSYVASQSSTSSGVMTSSNSMATTTAASSSSSTMATTSDSSSAAAQTTGTSSTSPTSSAAASTAATSSATPSNAAAMLVPGVGAGFGLALGWLL